MNNARIAEPSTGANRTGMPPPLKRRKVRKGTISCWECKRRKIRCTFATPNESVCDGCRSRRIKCISQQFDDRAVERGDKTGEWSQTEMVAERLSTPDGSDATNSDSHVGECANQKAAVSVIYFHDK